MKDGTIKLGDGRALAYAEYGDPVGRPVFYFHGFPGSRLEAALADSAASSVSMRLVAVDRPGYGRSDFKPRRRILDWPEDVSELARELAIDRFSVLGVSGGGPYGIPSARATRPPHAVLSRGCPLLGGLQPHA
jgi:pimeloyl-ACP methyl ester carboxylesterase